MKFWNKARSGQSHRHVAHYERVLDTSLELQCICRNREVGRVAEQVALAEMDRLERIFSAYSPDSEFSRWQTSFDEEIPVSSPLAQVLELAEQWRIRTQGAFNPAVGVFTRLWAEHAERGFAPDNAALEPFLSALQSPLWSVNSETNTACRLNRFPASLNAIAKGYIVDAACVAVSQIPDVQEIMINIGGDIRHCGQTPIQVGITDPFVDAENAPPVGIVHIKNQGIATSGNFRRGFQIGEQWHSHLIDPRAGYPAEHIVSASVIAESAMLADILATACSILEPQESLKLTEDLPSVGLFLITNKQERLCNAFWQDCVVGA